jgi:hypothetical protein
MKFLIKLTVIVLAAITLFSCEIQEMDEPGLLVPKTVDEDPLLPGIEIGFYMKGHEIKLGDKIPLFERKSFKIINTLNGSFGNINTKHFNSKKLAIADKLGIGYRF